MDVWKRTFPRERLHGQDGENLAWNVPHTVCLGSNKVEKDKRGTQQNAFFWSGKGTLISTATQAFCFLDQLKLLWKGVSLHLTVLH